MERDEIGASWRSCNHCWCSNKCCDIYGAIHESFCCQAETTRANHPLGLSGFGSTCSCGTNVTREQAENNNGLRFRAWEPKAISVTWGREERRPCRGRADGRCIKDESGRWVRMHVMVSLITYRWAGQYIGPPGDGSGSLIRSGRHVVEFA